ncbi:MAG TPA: efflux RND transporter permease subunit, partial [Chitinophagaceae bacterium]|nr:efflux RND transporter permease subunit [Chitinophagaceae bacterium]
MAVLMLVILLAGAWFFSKMQSALFPEITFPNIKIIADAGQQPVGKMMIAVTRPLENAIKKVPGLTTVRSTTSRGSCEISAFLDWNADINYSQQQIEARIAAIKADLPTNISINVERMNPSILPVMGYSLESKSRTPIDLKMMALYTIKPFLSQVKGVSEVRVIGGKTKEYWLVIDQQKMNTLGLTAEGIANKLSQSNFIQSNGYLSDYRQMYLT